MENFISFFSITIKGEFYIIKIRLIELIKISWLQGWAEQKKNYRTEQNRICSVLFCSVLIFRTNKGFLKKINYI